jgi:hypothetical protein
MPGFGVRLGRVVLQETSSPLDLGPGMTRSGPADLGAPHNLKPHPFARHRPCGTFVRPAYDPADRSDVLGIGVVFDVHDRLDPTVPLPSERHAIWWPAQTPLDYWPLRLQDDILAAAS